MGSNKIKGVRMEDDLIEEGTRQAAKLGLNLSEYLRLFIKLDGATRLISKLTTKEPK
jgi:antitoxin component of RelBE/YafQ-DinJ toxin-antitoxin module